MQYFQRFIKNRFFPKYDEVLHTLDIIGRMELQVTTKFEENDIIVVGYPKSGNTLFQNLICGVVYNIDVREMPQKLVGHLVPDIMAYPYYQRYFNPTYFKSHYLPQPEYRKVIYLVRDGRDALVSNYHFRRAAGLKEDWYQLLQNLPRSQFGEWHNHVEEWLRNPYQAEMMTIKYEDLMTKPLEEMVRFIQFVGIERSKDKLQVAINNAHFDNAQRREELFGMPKNFPQDKRFVRRGKIGSYKDEMPENILALFMEEAKATLEKLGYV
jgi:Sulfotransferase domain